MAAKKTAISKSAFIRKQPSSMSAADVVKKAKAEGIQFAAQLVYNVRGAKKKARKSVPKQASSPMGPPSKSKPVSKAAFVRSLPITMSAKDVVAEAKKQGIKIAERYVYWARSSGTGLAKTTVTRQAARRPTARQAPAITRPITTHSKAEELLRAVAAEIGLGRALELLEAERARVHAVLRG
jgi:hypothetical protein